MKIIKKMIENIVETYKDDSIKTIIGSFDDICKEIEYQVNKKENDDFKMQNAIVYDRKYSDNIKKSDIVNYDSLIDKSGLNIEQNHGGINKNNNNINLSKSNSINQEKLSSDLESFNFNDDSIPNKDIQVLSPPDLIK